jgi:3-oxoacyl-[acyl-carrier-protein] synthase II/beta-ketoacyl ACP synthase
VVSIGLALGSTEEIPVQHDAWREKGLRAVSPLTVQM